MSNTNPSTHEQRLKAHKRLIIASIVGFFAAPLVLFNDWKSISDFGTATLVVCVSFYIIFSVGIFLFFLRRYKKIAREPRE